jgi:hypothetical protein
VSSFAISQNIEKLSDCFPSIIPVRLTATIRLSSFLGLGAKVVDMLASFLINHAQDYSPELYTNLAFIKSEYFILVNCIIISSYFYV